MAAFLLQIYNPDNPAQTAIVEWSTIMDAPVSAGFRTDRDLEEYIEQRYGTQGLERLPPRLKRVRECGHSQLEPGGTVDEMIVANRAGPNETELDMRGLWRNYAMTLAEQRVAEHRERDELVAEELARAMCGTCSRDALAAKLLKFGRHFRGG